MMYDAECILYKIICIHVYIYIEMYIEVYIEYVSKCLLSSQIPDTMSTQQSVQASAPHADEISQMGCHQDSGQ